MTATKQTLTLSQVNGGPFKCMPGCEVEIGAERILCNNIVLPWEFNPHNVRLFVIGNEFGAVCAVWADCDRDAMDEMVDSGLSDGFLVSEEDQALATEEEQEEWVRLGNAGEPCDLTNAWIQTVRLEEHKDCHLMCDFAEARGESRTTLEA